MIQFLVIPNFTDIVEAKTTRQVYKQASRLHRRLMKRYHTHKSGPSDDSRSKKVLGALDKIGAHPRKTDLSAYGREIENARQQGQVGRGKLGDRVVLPLSRKLAIKTAKGFLTNARNVRKYGTRFPNG